MGLVKDSSKPEDEDPEPKADPYEDLSDRMQHFVDLGFDEFTAWMLAWKRVSWSECRERFLKRGASHEVTARYFLSD
ncbi:MAG TPA: hypothetical protein VNN79_03365 [Actinomycetota bacterium]|nr:hypothetical protein [Actinomycetota bacterium]